MNVKTTVPTGFLPDIGMAPSNTPSIFLSVAHCLFFVLQESTEKWVWSRQTSSQLLSQQFLRSWYMIEHFEEWRSSWCASPNRTCHDLQVDVADKFVYCFSQTRFFLNGRWAIKQFHQASMERWTRSSFYISQEIQSTLKVVVVNDSQEVHFWICLDYIKGYGGKDRPLMQPDNIWWIRPITVAVV